VRQLRHDEQAIASRIQVRDKVDISAIKKPSLMTAFLSFISSESVDVTTDSGRSVAN